MHLTYLGPSHDTEDGRPNLPAESVLPLPQGWPAADHDEPDEALAAEKCASGLYEELDSTEGRIEFVRSAGRKPRARGEAVDVDPTEITPVDTDGVPGNGGFGTATGDPFGATPPTEG